MSIAEQMPKSWDPVVNAWSNTTKAEQLKAFIREERSKHEVFPGTKKSVSSASIDSSAESQSCDHRSGSVSYA